MDIYQQLIAQIQAINPVATLPVAAVSDLDQDIADLYEVPRLLLNPNAGQNLLASSQRVFGIASRWLGSSERLTSWLQTYLQTCGV